jgi:SnoaL-like domain
LSIHPFRAAFETRDLDAWIGALAPDVVVHSPIIRTPFTSRDAVAELYGVLFNALGQLDISDEFAVGDSHAFFWRVDIDGRWVEGADVVRHDEHGMICEITALIRPLADIAVFAAAVGPPLARKRGWLRVPLLRLLTLPLRAILIIADAIATRLVQRR